MKTLKRLFLSALLVGLAVFSTALAGSAYGGIATSRSPAVDQLGDEDRGGDRQLRLRVDQRTP